MTTDFRPVQAEFLLPHELQAALTARSIAYLPIGSYEFHGQHLPIGVDGLQAHGVCLRAATVTGGIVYPPLYYGTGGGHTDYPWTIMMETDAEITALLARSLSMLQEFGVRQAVLFTGHFAPEQLSLISRLAADWNARENDLQVLALGINMAQSAPIAPDHAGLFETSLISALWPDRVQLDALPSLLSTPSPDPDGDVTGAHRHDPLHPLHGVFGPDPRTLNSVAAQALLDAVVAWLIGLIGLIGPPSRSSRRLP